MPLQFLREIGEKTEAVSPELLAVPEIVEAIKLSEQAAYNPGELEIYEQYWDSVRVERTFVGDAYRTGHAAGHAAGHAVGREEGRVEERYLIARQLLLSNLDVEFVAKNTGIDIELLQKWREEVKH